MNDNADQLAKKFFDIDGDKVGSFVDVSLALSDVKLQGACHGLECGDVVSFMSLPARKFTIAYSKNEIRIFPGEMLPKSLSKDFKTQTENFFSYFVYTDKGMFFLIASKFDFLDFVSKMSWNNPFEEAELLHKIAQKFGVQMNLRNAKYFPGDDTTSINVFESKNGFSFIALQL